MASGPFGASSEIVAQRRDVERFEESLTTGAGVRESDDIALDSPWWRLGAISARTGEGADLDALERTLAAGRPGTSKKAEHRGPPWTWNESEVSQDARRLFREAVDRTFGGSDGDGWTGELVSIDGSAQSASLHAVAESGWQQLSGKAAELLGTLREHVGCVAWLALHSSDTTFRSGSAPELPGTVLLSTDQAEAPGYFPEAFVHEAAHCKFYDLCAARNIVADLQVEGEPWMAEIPWVTETARRPKRWPVDQVLAAGHAYLHIALLAGCFVASEIDSVIKSHWQGVCAESVKRAEFLLSKLDEVRIDALGPDGRAFVEWMKGIVWAIRCLLAHVGSGWSGTGPYIRLRFPVRTLRGRSSDYALVGIAEANETMWVPVDALPILEATHPLTIGDVAVAKLAVAASAPADALIDAINLVGELEAMGMVETDQRDGAGSFAQQEESYDDR